MKKILFVFLFFLLAIPFISFAQESKKEAVYFFASWCPHCQKVDEYFKEHGLYDKYRINKYDFDDQENKILLSKILQAKGVQSVGIPVVIVDDKVLQGDSVIIESFQNEINKSKNTTLDFVAEFDGEKKSLSKFQDNKQKSQLITSISIPILIGAALVDAINPCAFAVLIILMATVLNTKGKKQALGAGLLFSLAVFISYLLMGFGVYSVITIFNLPKIISLVVGGIAILIGLANLKDAFWYGKVFIMEVPLSWRPQMKSILKHVTSPLGALGAGFLVSLFLLPCTSGPYIVILGLLAEKVETVKTIYLLFLYNIIFVAPMILITLAVSYFGVKAKKLEEMRQENLRLLHFWAGVIMVGIGWYLISGWI